MILLGWCLCHPKWCACIVINYNWHRIIIIVKSTTNLSNVSLLTWYPLYNSYCTIHSRSTLDRKFHYCDRTHQLVFRRCSSQSFFGRDFQSILSQDTNAIRAIKRQILKLYGALLASVSCPALDNFLHRYMRCKKPLAAKDWSQHSENSKIQISNEYSVFGCVVCEEIIFTEFSAAGLKC